MATELGVSQVGHLAQCYEKPAINTSARQREMQDFRRTLGAAAHRWNALRYASAASAAQPQPGVYGGCAAEAGVSEASGSRVSGCPRALREARFYFNPYHMVPRKKKREHTRQSGQTEDNGHDRALDLCNTTACWYCHTSLRGDTLIKTRSISSRAAFTAPRAAQISNPRSISSSSCAPLSAPSERSPCPRQRPGRVSSRSACTAVC